MMVRPVDTISEVEQFFAGSKIEYNAKGITDTRADIVDLKWLTPQIALLEVRWPWLDAEGNERGEETSTYVLRRNDGGKLKIQAAIMHGTG